MKLSKLFDPGQVSAFMRHVYSDTATAIVVLSAVGLYQGDATALGNAIHKIGDGVISIVTGVSVIVQIVSPMYASWTASRSYKLQALNADPQIQKVIAKPGTAAAAVADSIPGNKVTVA